MFKNFKLSIFFFEEKLNQHEKLKKVEFLKEFNRYQIYFNNNKNLTKFEKTKGNKLIFFFITIYRILKSIVNYKKFK